MTSRIILIAALLLAALWLLLFADWSDEPPDDSTRVVAAWGSETPPYVLEESMFTTTTTARARTAPRRVHSSSTGRAAIVETESSIRGFPCGPTHDLPPCYVLRRESMMAADPARVWNGNCYMPVGSLSQCGRSTASGLWQALRSTWAGFGGYVNAADAPVDVQNEFARRLWNRGAGCAHWRAC